MNENQAADFIDTAEEKKSIKGRSLWKDAYRRFMKNKAAVSSVFVLFAVVLFSIIGPFFSVWNKEEIDWNALTDIVEMGKPSIQSGHYFGTDDLGRDLYSRTIQAIKTSLLVGVIGAFVALGIGTIYGTVSGFIGGKVDNIMMRLVDILIAVPFMLVIILLMVIFERSFLMLFIGIGIVSWLSMSRIVRGQTLTLKNREFIEAAFASGVAPMTIVIRHIIPNLLGVIIVYASLLIPDMILAESFISFIGLGIQEPNTSLGALISEGSKTISYGTYWQLLYPLFFFLVIMLSAFFIGDGLRDALDPKDR